VPIVGSIYQAVGGFRKVDVFVQNIIVVCFNVEELVADGKLADIGG